MSEGLWVGSEMSGCLDSRIRREQGEFINRPQRKTAAPVGITLFLKGKILCPQLAPHGEVPRSTKFPFSKEGGME